MNNIIAFIPARAGSKSIPGKNIKELGGKPLIAYSIEKAIACGIERVIVNTDGEDIAKVAREYGAEVMMRPSELAQDDTSMYQVLKSEIPKIEPLPELVMLLQPTSPFRKKIHIKIAISLLTSNFDKYDSLISVERVPEKYNPAQVIISIPSHGKKVILGKLITWEQKLKSFFTGIKYHNPPLLQGYPIFQRLTRKQDYPEAWIPTGSIYLFKTENVIKHGSIYGERVMLLETESEININSPEDWEKAELWLKKQ